MSTNIPIRWNPESDALLLGQIGLSASNSFESVVSSGFTDNEVSVEDPDFLSPDKEPNPAAYLIYGKSYAYDNDRQTTESFYADYGNVYSNGFHIHYTKKKKDLLLIYLGKGLFRYLNSASSSTYKEIYNFCKENDSAFPFSEDELKAFFNKKVSDSEFVEQYRSSEQKIYAASLSRLIALLQNPYDQESIDMVTKINALVLRMTVEANTTFSTIANEEANPFRNFWAAKAKSFSYDDLKKLEKQLRGMDNAVKRFQRGDFKTGDELIEFVNTFFVASNDDSRFLIHYPFIKLDASSRSTLIRLFIVADKRIFNRASIDSEIGAAEILLTLFYYCSQEDRLKIVTQLEKERALYQLFSLSYFDCFDQLALLIGNTYLTSIQDKKAELITQEIENGNNFMFDTRLLGKHNKENFDDDSRTITFEIKENAVLSLFGNAGSDVIANWVMDNADTDGSLLKPRKSYSPLDLIVLTPVTDVVFDGNELAQGQPYLMPACMAYYFFREETVSIAKEAFNIIFQTALCFTGIGEVIAAVRAGSVAAAVIGGLDVAIGAGGVVINTVPEIEKKHPEFVKYYNYFTYVWGLFRFGTSIRDSLKKRRQELLNEEREYDSLSALDDAISSKGGGTGFMQGRKLGRARIKYWMSEINRISNGKASIKIAREGTASLQALVRKGARAGFDPFKMEIVVRSGMTEYEMFHEFKHLEEFINVGFDDYVSGMLAFGGDGATDLIRTYKREMYVFNEIMKNAQKFNKYELKHAQDYIANLIKSGKSAGIDLN